MFLQKHIPSTMDSFVAGVRDSDAYSRFVRHLTDVVERYFLLFPELCSDMPLERLAMLASTLVGDDELSSKVIDCCYFFSLLHICYVPSLFLDFL